MCKAASLPAGGLPFESKSAYAARDVFSNGKGVCSLSERGMKSFFILLSWEY